MGLFQYYEFYAIDKELTAKEREEVDRLSSRFSPTARRAVFSYSYSDFSHNVEDVLLKYFDFFAYIANWGAKRIMFKIPEDLIDYKSIQKYDCVYENEYADEGILISKKSNYVLIDINTNEGEEGEYGWIPEDNDFSSKLKGLRENIIDGDYRALFIMWLYIKQQRYKCDQIGLDETIDKSLIPSNLKKLNSSLKELMRFFDLDIDWVLGAANYSDNTTKDEINHEDYLTQLPNEVKEDYLKKILAGEPNLTIQLKREIDTRFKPKKKEKKSTGKLNFGDLLKAAEKEQNKRIEAEKKQVEKARLKRLENIEKNKEEILKEIDFNIVKGTGKSYDEALAKILDLRDLAVHKGEEKEFGLWIAKLRKTMGRKPSMVKRLDKNNL